MNNNDMLFVFVLRKGAGWREEKRMKQECY